MKISHDELPEYGKHYLFFIQEGDRKMVFSCYFLTFNDIIGLRKVVFGECTDIYMQT